MRKYYVKQNPVQGNICFILGPNRIAIGQSSNLNPILSVANVKNIVLMSLYVALRTKLRIRRFELEPLLAGAWTWFATPSDLLPNNRYLVDHTYGRIYTTVTECLLGVRVRGYDVDLRITS